jgi:hypothetical protein
MLAANIEKRTKEIIKSKGKDGWIRVQKCANEFAKDVENNPRIKDTAESRKTKFYRFRKKIKNGRVEGLKVLSLPGNISYIGLSSADPRVIEGFIDHDKETLRNVKTGVGFLERRRLVGLEKNRLRDEEILKLQRKRASEKEIRILRKKFREEQFEKETGISLVPDDSDSKLELVRRENEIRRKYGLLQPSQFIEVRCLKRGIQIDLDDQTRKKLEKLASLNGVTVQELLRNIIIDCLFGFVDDGSVWSPKPDSK